MPLDESGIPSVRCFPVTRYPPRLRGHLFPLFYTPRTDAEPRKTGGSVGPSHPSDSEMDRPRAAVERNQPAELAPVPGWVAIVRVASAAAAASEPPGSFLCRARWGRLCWYDVRGSRAFVELLWALEELSATLCEVCGAPAVARDTWERGVHTLCPRHAVAVAAAGPNASAIYDRGWASLADSR